MRKELPNEVDITACGRGFRLSDEFVESVNEYLADTYGYCNDGWAIKIIVSNIGWDTSEEDAYEETSFMNDKYARKEYEYKLIKGE